MDQESLEYKPLTVVVQNSKASMNYKNKNDRKNFHEKEENSAEISPFGPKERLKTFASLGAMIFISF